MSFWLIISPVLLGYALFASIYLALDGFVRLPKHREFIEHPVFWFPLIFTIIVCVPMMLGEFGRGDMSPLPWEAFMNTKGGISEKGFSASLVVVADLWLFWIPANIWVNHQKAKPLKEFEGIGDENFKQYQKGYLSAFYELNKYRAYMARAINLLIGLMLMTENNPIMKLLGIFFSGEGVEP